MNDIPKSMKSIISRDDENSDITLLVIISTKNVINPTINPVKIRFIPLIPSSTSLPVKEIAIKPDLRTNRPMIRELLRPNR